MGRTQIECEEKQVRANKHHGFGNYPEKEKKEVFQAGNKSKFRCPGDEILLIVNESKLATFLILCKEQGTATSKSFKANALL